MTAKEKETVQMDCELNKPYIPVKWLKDGEDLAVTDRVNPVMDGYTQYLKFQDLTLEDGASYTCVFKDISTEGKLTVEGRAVIEKLNSSHHFINGHFILR